MKHRVIALSAAMLIAVGWSSVAEAAAAKKRLSREGAAAVTEARRIGLPIRTIRGCVQFAPPACKYVVMGGVKHSVAVKSEVPWLFWLNVPSYPPAPVGVEIIAEAATINRGSLNCGFDVAGNIVVAWVPTGRACVPQR